MLDLHKQAWAKYRMSVLYKQVQTKIPKTHSYTQSHMHHRAKTVKFAIHNHFSCCGPADEKATISCMRNSAHSMKGLGSVGVQGWTEFRVMGMYLVSGHVEHKAIVVQGLVDGEILVSRKSGSRWQGFFGMGRVWWCVESRGCVGWEIGMGMWGSGGMLGLT